MKVVQLFESNEDTRLACVGVFREQTGKLLVVTYNAPEGEAEDVALSLENRLNALIITYYRVHKNPAKG